jgi:hypothetical protein
VLLGRAATVQAGTGWLTTAAAAQNDSCVRCKMGRPTTAATCCTQWRSPVGAVPQPSRVQAVSLGPPSDAFFSIQPCSSSSVRQIYRSPQGLCRGLHLVITRPRREDPKSAREVAAGGLRQPAAALWVGSRVAPSHPHNPLPPVSSHVICSSLLDSL